MTNEEEPESGHPNKTTIILLSSTVLMLVWKYFGTTEAYTTYWQGTIEFAHPEAMAAFYQFFCCFLFLGLIPLLIVKLVLRERLADFGVGLGKRLFTIRSFLVAAPLFVIAGFIGARFPEMSKFFPVNKQVGLSTPFWLHACTFFMFYVGWEFHFRGFLQFGLAGPVGRANAILIQAMASSLLHIGQPFAETFAAVVAGILWGWLAYRTNSILSGMMQHFVLGITVDAVITFS